MLAILLVALAAGWLQQGTGFNQNSHYALVKALAYGTAKIDRTRSEVGDLGTLDVSLYKGHYYSDKAPGLALTTVGAYVSLKAAGMRTTGDPTQMLWALGLVGTVLPFALLLVLVRWLADRLEPGLGAATAVTAGLGTLLLPFGTLFFAHALSAFLVFASFALLWYERRGPAKLSLIGAGGIVAGLAVTTEYPNAIAAIVLGLYAIARRPWAQRGLSYVAGAVFGVAPLLLYDAWAFGSATHLSRIGSVTGSQQGFLGVAAPSLHVAVEVLFSSLGLLTLSPVLALGFVGAFVLYRRGDRAEALVFTAVPVLYVVYDSGYFSPFGGLGPPRYLVPAIPFLTLPLAVAFRRLPTTTAALGLASCLIAVFATSTHALAAYDGHWLHRIAKREFTQTAASVAGITGWYTIIPFFAAGALAVLCAALATRELRFRPAESALAGFAVLDWALIAAGAPRPAELGGRAEQLGAYGTLGLGLIGAAAATAALVRRSHPQPARHRHAA